MPELLILDFANDWQSLELGQTRDQFEQLLLPAYLSRQRWFASKGTAIERVELKSRFIFSGYSRNWLLATFRARLQGGRLEDYFVPLAVAWDSQPHPPPAGPNEVIAHIRKGDNTGTLRDALADSSFVAALIRGMGCNKTVSGSESALRFSHTHAYFPLREEDERDIRNIGAEQSNSSTLIARKMILKAYRKLEPGIQPELEIGRYLTDVAHYRNTPPLLGSIEQYDSAEQATALAVIQGFIPNRGDGWSFALRHLKRIFDGVFPDSSSDPGDGVSSVLAERLGARVAELHQAFTIRNGDPAFEPEPIEASDVARWKQQIQSEAETAFGLLANAENMLPPEQHARVKALLCQLAQILHLIKGFELGPGPAIMKTRFHGDLHLGQVLVAGDDFYIIDFEGEPARPFAQRRAKHSPLRDVAGMLRSLNYAAWSALFEAGAGEPEKFKILEKAAVEWERKASSAFMRGYKSAIEGCSACPSDPQTFTRLLDLFIVEKALYEIRYELANRPDWSRIPVEGIMSLLARRPGKS